ncbi:hypothetical protein BC835DRAFT_1103529 [Cytidiella melzeri]|nr:hypothetical protein BC835DRAFT_1103529 [Cytidiella melzeri]
MRFSNFLVLCATILVTASLHTLTVSAMPYGYSTHSGYTRSHLYDRSDAADLQHQAHREAYMRRDAEANVLHPRVVDYDSTSPHLSRASEERVKARARRNLQSSGLSDLSSKASSAFKKSPPPAKGYGSYFSNLAGSAIARRI